MMDNLASIIRSIFVYDPQYPLIFPTGIFWVLFLVFLPILAALKRNRMRMMLFVVGFSLFFYYKSSGIFVLVLFATSVADWLLSKAIVSTRVKWQKQMSMALSLTLSIGALVYFKYADFFRWNWNMMVEGNFQPLDLVLPVGISFYTFQSASYIIDVYRGKVRPTETWLEYAFFLTFFPALVAGPIVRADYFLPQIRENRHATRTEMYAGLWLIIVGVVKKAIIADYIAQYNDLIFTTPGSYTGFENLMGMIGYVMQIYCDFSGYSDMAIGLALIMGFRLAKNFDFPYKSRNISQFWRRWHISLSSWMRDYIYIPLGGNRRGTLRTYINNLVTMLVAGLWHGAAWKFIFWGGIHGIALVVHRMCLPWLKRIPDTRWVKVCSWAATMLFVSVTFVYFRAASLHDAWLIIRSIFTDFDPAIIIPFVKTRLLWLGMLAFIITAHAIDERRWERLADRFVNSPWAVKLIIFIVVIQLVVQLRTADVAPFIYFQF